MTGKWTFSVPFVIAPVDRHALSARVQKSAGVAHFPISGKSARPSEGGGPCQPLFLSVGAPQSSPLSALVAPPQPPERSTAMSASAREDAAKRSKMRSPRMTSDSEHRQLEITILETRLKQAHEANARAKRAKQQTSDARLSTMKWLRDEKAEALHQAKLATVKALILQLEEDTAIAVLSEQQGYEVERSPAKSFRAGTDSGDDEMKRILAGIVLPAASSHRAEEEHKQTQETEGGQSKALERCVSSLRVRGWDGRHTN